MPIPDSTRTAPSPLHSRPAPLWLHIGFWICIVIAVAVVIRRLAALAHPSSSSPPQMAALDQVFASHAALTLAHIIPALAFVLITPWALLPRFAALHWPQRWLFPLGLIVSLTAYALSADAVGGWTERSAVLFFNSLFLFSLVRARIESTRAHSKSSRRWLLRAVVVLLGIATTRPVMGVFFAISARTHLTPHQFFGIAFWIGFSINWIVVEIWLRTNPSNWNQPSAVRSQTSRPSRGDGI